MLSLGAVWSPGVRLLRTAKEGCVRCARGVSVRCGGRKKREEKGWGERRP